MPLIGDVAALITQHRRAPRSSIGIQLSAPFLVFGLLFNLGLGVLSRLMPQMQVFFVGLPLSILLGFLILLLVLGAMMGIFLDYVGERAAPARAAFVRARMADEHDDTERIRRPDPKAARRRAQARRRRQEPGGQHLVRDRRRDAGADGVLRLDEPRACTTTHARADRQSAHQSAVDGRGLLAAVPARSASR